MRERLMTWLRLIRHQWQTWDDLYTDREEEED